MREPYGNEAAEANATRAYIVLWHTDHASGQLGGPDAIYDTEQEAARIGREWKREMVAVEPTKVSRRHARLEYQWEVVEGWCVDGSFVREDDDA